MELNNGNMPRLMEKLDVSSLSFRILRVGKFCNHSISFEDVSSKGGLKALPKARKIAPNHGKILAPIYMHLRVVVLTPMCMCTQNKKINFISLLKQSVEHTPFGT